mmetsp:Transcript_23416/g.3844  ORF Transcript_23416/g.3844 Transcript_23416/m.3844 type:complete len:93 (+) Transcript_23416:519-797(+)
MKEINSEIPLADVSHIILDEVHERHLYTDILLGVIKTLILPKRPDLKVIVTSATINTESFINYFDNCKVLEFNEKMFPVNVVNANNERYFML